MEILDYKPKQVIVSIGGKEYPVAPRTELIEKAIREHDKNLAAKSAFESDYSLVEILIGEAAAKELFPLGEKENLDRLYYIATKLVEAYRAPYQEIVDANAKDKLAPIVEQFKELSESIKPLLEFNAPMPSKAARKK